MRFWFDTEFIDDGKQIHLISIGIAAQDGREYYAEFIPAYDLRNHGANEWVVKNVGPYLQDVLALRFPREASIEIVDFVGKNPEFWAYVADYDWVALSQLYGPLINRPATWPWTALDTYQLPDFRRYVVESAQAHNALSDALALKESWLRWRAAWPDFPLPEHRSPRP